MPLINAPYLEGWLTLGDAARDLGISRQALYELADKGRADTVRRVGRGRPVYLIREAEVARIREGLDPEAQRRGRLAHEERSEDPVPDQAEFVAAVG